MQNKKSYSKESNFSKGGKPKGYKKSDFSDTTQNKNVKDAQTGQNQNQNQNQNKNASRYCKECKIKSHWTSDCRKLKAKNEKSQKKQINNVEASYDANEQHGHCQALHDDFGTFSSNALCAVDSRNVVIDTFATKITSHPLATNEPLMAVLNLENVVSLQLEGDTAASHNIISKTCFEELQANLLKHGKEKSKSLP